MILSEMSLAEYFSMFFTSSLLRSFSYFSVLFVNADKVDQTSLNLSKVKVNVKSTDENVWNGHSAHTLWQLNYNKPDKQKTSL